jgi:hypothetical protein
MWPSNKIADKAFRFFTTAAALCVTISTLLHFVLFASDSEAYRQWVAIQIALQSLAVVLLWLVRRYNPIALVLLFATSIPFTYINAVYTNYGNPVLQVLVVTIGWAVYGYLVFGVRKKFQKRMGGDHVSAT